MSLKDTINSDLIANMKSKTSFNVKVLRGLNAAIKQVEVDSKKEVSEEQILSILQKQIKQRKESLKIYSENSRKDLADIEERELNLLKGYLPEQMPEEQLNLLIERVISDLKATSMKDMGKVMSIVKPLTAGKADPAKVSSLIKSKLS